MSKPTPKKTTRVTMQLDPKLEARLAKHHRSEQAERPFLSLSDVLRELLDLGLRTQERQADPLGDGGR